MSRRPVIVIEFDDEGDPTVSVDGATGPMCEVLTQDLEKDLGSVQRRDLKPEHRQRAAATTRARQRT